MSKSLTASAPAAGFEEIKTGSNKGDHFLASIVAARYEAQALLEFSTVGRSLSLYETLIGGGRATAQAGSL